MSKYPQSLIYFMWPWQVHFRISCQTGAESLFNSLDRGLQPKVFMVGFNVNKESRFLPICIEPEDLDYPLEEFMDIESVADILRSTDEYRDMLYTGSGMQEEMDKRFQNRTFREALEKKLNESKYNKGTICFAAASVRVADHQVFVILELNKDVYNSHLYLKKEKTEQRIKLFRSFLETTVQEYLDEKERNLYLPEPGRNLSGDSRLSDELLRGGARLFMYTISSKGVNYQGLHGLFDTCNELSLYRYENAENYGHLMIAKKDHPDIEMTLEVDEPFEISELRKTRKMLELTNDEVAVICDSYHILGLGKIMPTYNPRSEEIFSIYFKGVHCWDVFHANINVLQMRYGLPQFPKETINKERFFLDAQRLFPGISLVDLKNLYSLATAASKQEKGAMLVISDKAQGEAIRFGKRCISIKPIKLDEDLLLNLTSIDGGVLIDPKGLAYAKGVILDGIVGTEGDAGRGSRYNSAVTYCEHKSATQATMIVVVSSDRMVDVIPQLMPQIKHSDILNLISFLEKLNSKKEFNRSSFYETMELLINRRFYLTPVECKRINKLKADIQQLDKQDNDSLQRIFEDFIPNSRMNDSYYI